MLWYFLTTSFLLGAVIGSFTNCFVWRLHEKETLLDRSYCPKCREKIAWFDNIPVLSFLILGGRCRRCDKKISWQYPLAEFTTAFLFALAFFIESKIVIGSLNFTDNLYLLGDNKFLLPLVRDWLIIFVLTAIFIYDCRWYLIPDKIVIPAVAILFILDIFLGFSWLELFACALIGGGFFLFQLLVSNGKWVGGGDIRLGVLLGLVTGRYEELVLAIILTYFIGSVIGITLVIFGKKEWGSKVPLGVFMAPALLITLFWGQQIIRWYLGMLY